MSMQLTPQELAWLDQEQRRTADVIRRDGMAIEYVIGDDATRTPSVAYTIGLFGIGHPELVVFGLAPHNAGPVLNDVGARVRAGSVLVPGALVDFDDWAHSVTVEAVPNPGEILFSANAHYGRSPFASVPALQLTYDDVDGRFPWDADYRRPQWVQPRPGAFRA